MHTSAAAQQEAGGRARLDAGTIRRIGVAYLVGACQWYVDWGNPFGPDVTRHQVHWMLIDASVALLLTPLLIWRHRWPRTILAVLTIGAVFSTSLVPALGMTLISFAARRRGKELLVAFWLWLGCGLLNDIVQTPVLTGGKPLIQGDARDVFYFLLCIGLLFCVSVAVGWDRGTRAELSRSWQRGAELAHREQLARVGQAQTAERARIAREMHDVLAHKISLISLHAGVLAYKDDLSHEESVETATLIRDTAHQALEELREVLGVLRDEESTAVAPPQPSMLELPRLIAEEETAGAQITLQVADDFWRIAARIGPATSRHAHRIIQESLTNARKHAQGLPVLVEVHGDPASGLHICVSNPLGYRSSTVPGSGRGLVGLTERAALAGGRLTISHDDSSFVVRADLPWNVKMGS